MRITIIAATGGIGRQLLEQALERGHSVTAVVRSPALLARPVARVVQMDLTAPDPAALAEAVEGADAVLSAFGPRSRADHGITAAGTRLLIEAMQITGCAGWWRSAPYYGARRRPADPPLPGTIRRRGPSCASLAPRSPAASSGPTSPTLP